FPVDFGQTLLGHVQNVMRFRKKIHCNVEEKKSEGRSPKSERNPIGYWISFGFRVSDFGFTFRLCPFCKLNFNALDCICRSWACGWTRMNRSPDRNGSSSVKPTP